MFPTSSSFMLDNEYPLSFHILDPSFASALVVVIPLTVGSKGASILEHENVIFLNYQLGDLVIFTI